MDAHSLVGAWKLVSFEMRDDEGQITFPLGRDVRGYIIYTENGYISVSLMSADRQPFARGDMLAGTMEEKERAADTYISYCGTYELRENTVVHHVEVSFFPNWIGTDIVRQAELSGDRLSLNTPPILVAGKMRTGHLIWQRT